MFKLLFVVFLLFSGCSNAPENGEATYLDKNDSAFTSNSKDTDNKIDDKNTTVISEKKPSLLYTGKTGITVEEGKSTIVNFLLQNGDANTLILSESSLETIIFSKNPECNSAGKCSVSLLALKKGNAKVTVSLKENIAEDFYIFITVTEKEVELKTESLLFSQTSNSLIEDGINLEINESVNIDFIVKDFNSKTKIKESHDDEIISTNLDCKSSSCQITITGNKEGNDTIKVYVDKNIFVSLNIPVNVTELNSSDEVNVTEENISIPDKNLTDENETQFGLGEISFDFASGQSTTLQVDEGENFIITTIVTFPRKADETILVVSTADKLVEIVSTKLDQNLSDNKKMIFRTEIGALSMGAERIIFRIKDSNLSIALNIVIKQMTCGLSESSYDILKSEASNSNIILGTKFGFNSVEIIYPKITTDSQIGFQNFSYLSDNGKGGVVHSKNSTLAFAFVKFVKELEGESYKIKYRKDGNSELKCLTGVFPFRDIVQAEENVQIEEASPPPAPK